MAKAKMSLAYQALTHAKAYADEHARDNEYITDDYKFNENDCYVKVRDAEPIYDLIDDAKTITELNRLLATYVGEKMKRTDVFTTGNGFDGKGFYDAMKKTIPILLNEEDEETWEHSGTECRGWYRVWGDIKKIKPYYCSMDLGRDQWMAESFFKSGAITQQEFDAYKTMMTLRMMKDCLDDNGFPSAKKIRAYWRPECQEQVLDMRLIRMLEAA